MADGAFRFHQPGAGPFYPSQHTNQRAHNRATSPHRSNKPFSTDTPSPSRSPANTGLTQNYNMYSHNGFQNQHMINGGQNHQRYGGGMHVPKYQQNHHGHHNQVNQHHNAHHPQGQIGHQHNISSGTFQSATPHLAAYGHDQLQNGNRDTGVHDELEDGNEHWQEQRRLWEEYGGATESHHRARTVAQQSKGITFGGPLGGGSNNDDIQFDDRIRTMVTPQQKGQIWTELDLGGQGLRALSPALFRSYHFLTRLDLGHNALNSLPSTIGQLKNLEFLDVSFNNLEDLPEEIGMLTNLKTFLLFGNNLEALPNELGYLYRLDTLGVYGNPLSADPQIKAKMSEGGTKSVIMYLRETMDPPQEPASRPWYKIADPGEAETFKALTYNILCEKAATPQMYGYVPEGVLDWMYRRQLILEEIQELDADFVCLQELDKHSYDEFFRSALSVKGYKGFYGQKGRAETLGDNAKYVDGCGTFWKDKKYIALDQQHIVLGRKAIARPGAKASADMLNRVWQRDDISTVCLFENRATGSRIIVVNSHLFWNPAFKDVKLIQAAVLMEELSKLSKKYAEWPAVKNKQVFRFSNDDSDPLPEPGPSLVYKHGTQIPMVICGDFNSSAGSAVYDLFTNRVLQADHEDLSGRHYGTFSSDGMAHQFTIKSAYKDIDDQMGFTNYTPNFVATLDYIWYSSNSLTVTGLHGEIDQEYLRRVPGFPNFHFPSDHLALMAEFKVEKVKPPAEEVKADFGPSSNR